MAFHGPLVAFARLLVELASRTYTHALTASSTAQHHCYHRLCTSPRVDDIYWQTSTTSKTPKLRAYAKFPTEICSISEPNYFGTFNQRSSALPHLLLCGLIFSLHDGSIDDTTSAADTAEAFGLKKQVLHQLKK